ncbi:hypothetical protein LINPERHAP1_LOCUS24607 [Linum perenne]
MFFQMSVSLKSSDDWRPREELFRL